MHNLGAFKDARLLSETMLNGASWGPEIFSTYAAERRERIRQQKPSRAIWCKRISRDARLSVRFEVNGPAVKPIAG
jgi:hypothetical protein